MTAYNIALYFFSDIAQILESLMQHKDQIKVKPFFIDPYPARSLQWEAAIASYCKNINGFARAHWSYMEGEDFTSFYKIEDLSLILPYAEKNQIEEFIDNNKEEVALPSNLYESIFMAQRTLAGLKSHIDLMAYTRQAHAFWVRYLKFCKIDALISTNVPHAFTDFLLTEACRTVGIPCICSDVVNLKRGTYYIDLTSGKHIKNQQQRDKRAIELIELKEAINNTDESNKTNSKNIYTKESNANARKAKREINSFLISGTAEANFIVNEKIRLAKEYDNLVKFKPVPSNKMRYNYLFLHYQPEASSIPLAGRYADQMIAIENIKSKMKEDDCLIIKEHPRQFIEYGNIKQNHHHIANVLGFRKYNFYKEAVSLRSVYLCPRNTSVKSILRHEKTVIWSPTGSINLQAFLCGCNFEELDTYTPYKYLIPHKTAPMHERKQIAFNTLSKYIWKSFKQDFETHIQSLDAANLVINLTKSIFSNKTKSIKYE